LQTSPPPSLHAARGATGAPVTGEQVPTCPVRLHAWHCPVHAPSQHTPSTQLPEPHSALDEHVVPRSFEQIPLLPASAHELPIGHVPVAQQTLSTQKPD
jgi:hypothetical protein